MLITNDWALWGLATLMFLVGFGSRRLMGKGYLISSVTGLMFAIIGVALVLFNQMTR